MSTFGQMKTWVAKRLQDPSGTAVSSSDVGDLINQAIDYWKNTRFEFNEKTDSATLTLSDPSIPLPSAWFVPSIDNCFAIEYSGIRYPLKKVSEEYYNQIYLSNGVGQPFWFAKMASSGYKCYPIPDRAYTILRYYLSNYNALVNDSDTNDFTDNADNLIKYTAVAYGSRDLRQDLKMYDAFWQQAITERDDLLATTRKANATGSLTLHSGLI